MTSQVPRGRLVNDDSFNVVELSGKTIEQIVAYRDPDQPTNSAVIVGIRFAESELWHRFFLDAGIGFWEECAEADAFYDFGTCERIDVLEKWSISRPLLVDVKCIGNMEQGTYSSFRWRLNSGDLSLSYTDRGDSESPTKLCFSMVERD